MKRMTAIASAAVLMAGAAAWPHAAAAADQHGKHSGSAMSRTDEGMAGTSMLESRVLANLAEKAWVGGDFEVKATSNGVITLSGTVPNESSRQRMLRIARWTIGVVEVRDQLRVDPSSARPAGAPVADGELARRVAQQIAGTVPGTKAGEDWWLTGWRVEGEQNRWNIVIEANEGQITLEGEVPRLALLRQAVDAARKVPGVRSVRSQLELEPSLTARWDYRDRWGYPYAYPYARPYDRDYFLFYDLDRARMDPHGYRSLHEMIGEVTSVDRDRGRVSLKTSEGTLDLHFPSSALRDVKKGDRLTVGLGLKEPGTESASPRTERSGSR